MLAAALETTRADINAAAQELIERAGLLGLG